MIYDENDNISPNRYDNTDQTDASALKGLSAERVGPKLAYCSSTAMLKSNSPFNNLTNS